VTGTGSGSSLLPVSTVCCDQEAGPDSLHLICNCCGRPP
jgi:hypothetical protein